MSYSGVVDLINSNTEAKNYFDSLSAEVQNALKAHGDGINNIDELKHFAEVFKKQGGKPW